MEKGKKGPKTRSPSSPKGKVKLSKLHRAYYFKKRVYSLPATLKTSKDKLKAAKIAASSLVYSPMHKMWRNVNAEGIFLRAIKQIQDERKPRALWEKRWALWKKFRSPLSNNTTLKLSHRVRAWNQAREERRRTRRGPRTPEGEPPSSATSTPSRPIPTLTATAEELNAGTVADVEELGVETPSRRPKLATRRQLFPPETATVVQATADSSGLKMVIRLRKGDNGNDSDNSDFELQTAPSTPAEVRTPASSVSMLSDGSPEVTSEYWRDRNSEPSTHYSPVSVKSEPAQSSPANYSPVSSISLESPNRACAMFPSPEVECDRATWRSGMKDSADRMMHERRGKGLWDSYCEMMKALQCLNTAIEREKEENIVGRFHRLSHLRNELEELKNEAVRDISEHGDSPQKKIVVSPAPTWMLESDEEDPSNNGTSHTEQEDLSSKSTESNQEREVDN